MDGNARVTVRMTLEENLREQTSRSCPPEFETVGLSDYNPTDNSRGGAQSRRPVQSTPSFVQGWITSGLVKYRRPARPPKD